MNLNVERNLSITEFSAIPRPEGLGLDDWLTTCYYKLYSSLNLLMDVMYYGTVKILDSLVGLGPMEVNFVEIWKFLAGLGLFLLSIGFVEEALKILGSRRFKILLRKYTDNHLKAIVSGAIATAILQSSSAVTLMLLALVGSQVIHFSHALGIILGANFGTTFTGWIVSFFGFKVKISEYVFPIIAVGTLIYVFFPGQQKWRTWGKFIFGFGLLFFGLDLMKESMAGLHGVFDPASISGYHYLVFSLFGAIFTAIIQSSSATMTITLAALSTQLVTLEAACALVVGADLGTTMTVMIGASSGGHRKKQVAAAHFLFNLITDIVALILLPWLLALVVWIYGGENPLYSLVTFYSGFNLLGIFLFFPFLNKFSNFITGLFKSSERALVLDISPNEPTAALVLLEGATLEFLKRTYVLNSTVMDHKTNHGLDQSMQSYFGNTDHYECYKQNKKYEAELLSYTVKMQEQELNEEQSFELKQVLSCARNCAYSAKSLKDIRHNLDEFGNSANEEVGQILSSMVHSFSEQYDHIEKILVTNEMSPTIFDELKNLGKDAKDNYMEFINQVNEKIHQKKLDLQHAPDLLNTNREIYNSHYFLVLALADYYLTKEQAEVFNL